MPIACAPGVSILGPVTQEQADLVLTKEAQAFVATLQRCFGARRRELLARREVRQKEIDAGRLPEFLPETKHVREGVWTAAPPAPGLVDRRVEITGVDAMLCVGGRARHRRCSCFISSTQ